MPLAQNTNGGIWPFRSLQGGIHHMCLRSKVQTCPPPRIQATDTGQRGAHGVCEGWMGQSQADRQETWRYREMGGVQNPQRFHWGLYICPGRAPPCVCTHTHCPGTQAHHCTHTLWTRNSAQTLRVGAEGGQTAACHGEAPQGLSCPCWEPNPRRCSTSPQHSF